MPRVGLYVEPILGTRIDELFEDLADDVAAGQCTFLRRVIYRLMNETSTLHTEIKDAIKQCQRYNEYDPIASVLRQKKERYERLYQRLDEVALYLRDEDQRRDKCL
jgi:hypothetical protein